MSLLQTNKAFKAFTAPLFFLQPNENENDLLHGYKLYLQKTGFFANILLYENFEPARGNIYIYIYM